MHEWNTPGNEARAAGIRLWLPVKVPQSTCGTVMMPITAINACHIFHAREFIGSRSVTRAENTSDERQNAATNAGVRYAGKQRATATCDATQLSHAIPSDALQCANVQYEC
jgi:hypothetical protein